VESNGKIPVEIHFSQRISIITVIQETQSSSRIFHIVGSIGLRETIAVEVFFLLERKKIGLLDYFNNNNIVSISAFVNLRSPHFPPDGFVYVISL
jgi:hypothetical protein